MKDLDERRTADAIAVVGLGLMGGSLALALAESRTGRRVRVLGADVNPQAVMRAKAMGAIADVWHEGEAGEDAPTLVILAMPVRAIAQWLKRQGRNLPAHCLVMDLGSTKQEIVAAMNELGVESVGGHPMCGKETSGIEFADADLYRGAKFVLTPTVRTTERVLDMARALIERIGAVPVVMDAVAHDRAAAAISHLPYLLSANLVNTVVGLRDDDALTLAASGYAGMTRLAASDTRMMGDSIATNRANIVALIDRYQHELALMRRMLATDDEAGWQAVLQEARRAKSGG